MMNAVGRLCMRLTVFLFNIRIAVVEQVEVCLAVERNASYRAAAPDNADWRNFEHVCVVFALRPRV